VFVPHDMTWVLEHETVDEPPAGVKLLRVERFGELRKWF
jgi:putative hydrolase of the HAD superfamily